MPSNAGDVDYTAAAQNYALRRKPDPRIAAQIMTALGQARTIINVGAGTGSYEPPDRYVTPVEPSAAMRARRPRHLAPALNATAQALPFDDHAFDAATAFLTVHQWPDQSAGLAELCRVAKRVVVLTFDPSILHHFWLGDYCPELLHAEARRFQPIEKIAAILTQHDRTVRTESVPIPIDCTDGVTEAYYARPELMLDPTVRAAQSAWSFVSQHDTDRFVQSLASDLASGTWDARHGHLRTQATFQGALRLIVAH